MIDVGADQISMALYHQVAGPGCGEKGEEGVFGACCVSEMLRSSSSTVCALKGVSMFQLEPRIREIPILELQDLELAVILH